MSNAPVEVKQAPPVPAADPWIVFRSEMDRLFDRFGSGFFGAGFPSLRRMFDVESPWRTEASTGLTLPAVDVTEDDAAYKLTAELPGMAEKDIEVTLRGDTLVLKGEKRAEKEEKTKSRYVAERSYGSFQRSFALPDAIDRDKIAADFAKGVLTITLPKTTEAKKQQKIEVKAA